MAKKRRTSRPRSTPSRQRADPHAHRASASGVFRPHDLPHCDVGVRRWRRPRPLPTGTAYEMPFGASPFHFSRGETFEALVKRDRYGLLLALLRDQLGFAVVDAKVIDLRSAYPKNAPDFAYALTRPSAFWPTSPDRTPTPSISSTVPSCRRTSAGDSLLRGRQPVGTLRRTALRGRDQELPGRRRTG